MFDGYIYKEPSTPLNKGMPSEEIISALGASRDQVVLNIIQRNGDFAPDTSRIFFHEAIVNNETFSRNFVDGGRSTKRILKSIQFKSAPGRSDHQTPVKWRAGNLQVTIQTGVNKPKPELLGVFCTRLSPGDAHRTGIAELANTEQQTANNLLNAGKSIWVVSLVQS